MPAQANLKGELKQSTLFQRSVIWWAAALVIFSPSLAMTLVNPTRTIDTNEFTYGFVDSVDASASGASVAVGQEAMLPPTVFDDTSKPAATRILKEVGKQAIDQPGHFLIGAGPIWISRYLVGVPWYGWVVTPLLAYREWLQWPSNRWWDPPLDWAFLSLGAVVATCRRRSAHRFLDGLSPLRRRLARGWSFRLARRSDTMPDLVHAHAMSTPGAGCGRVSLSAAAGAGSRR